MKPKYAALAMVLISVAVVAMLTGCSSFGSPQLCVKTDYGTFCYELPALKDK